MASSARCPNNLGAQAQRIWRDTVQNYDLSAAELRILEDACREADLIIRMEDELRTLPSLTVTGSMGQPVITELAKEIRQHRAAFATLIRNLKLPDAPSAGVRSVSARHAAQARWRRPGSGVAAASGVSGKAV